MEDHINGQESFIHVLQLDMSEVKLLHNLEWTRVVCHEKGLHPSGFLVAVLRHT